jgi:hypothetical protein
VQAVHERVLQQADVVGLRNITHKHQRVILRTLHAHTPHSGTSDDHYVLTIPSMTAFITTTARRSDPPASPLPKKVTWFYIHPPRGIPGSVSP